MAKENTKATPLTQEQLIQRETELKAGEEKLSQDRADFDKSLEAFKEEKQAFDQQKQKLDAREGALDQWDSDLKKLEQELLSSSDVVAPVSDTEPGIDFQYNGEAFKFADHAPKSFRYQGKVLSQEEMANEDEAIASLLGTGLIQKQ